MKLCISLPTRGRSKQLIATVTRSCANLALDNTVLMVQADDDDAETVAAKETIEAIDKRVTVNIKPREDTVAAKWNRALAEPADLYLVDADDAPFITPGYDGKLLGAAQRFPDGIGMVYGHLANASFSGVVAPTRKLCDKLGHIFPEHFPYWFVDHWTDDVARIIGRLSFADVRTDQTRVGVTQEMREPGWWATWFDAAYLVRRRIAHSIILDSDFASPEWLKDILLTHHPIIEYRSRWINSTVRHEAQHGRLPVVNTVTERYSRIKQRAIAMVPQLFDGMVEEEANMFRALLTPPTSVPSLKRAFA